MKRIILLLLVSIILIQCSKGGDDQELNEEQGTETFLFSINVIGNLFKETTTGHLYLSDANGDIIVDGALINNQETYLSAVFDINDVYDATLIYKVLTQGQTYYLTSTYEDVNPNTYNINEIEGLNPNQDRINLDLSNTGFPLEVISHSGSYISDGNPDNGGTFNFDSLLPASPGDYYAAFKSPDDNLPRYFWMENVNGNTNLNIDFTSLPFVNTSIITQFPTNESLSVNVHGFKNDDNNNIHHTVHFKGYQNGSNSDITLVPDNLFDYYGFHSNFNINNTTYYYSKKSQDIIQNISLPNFDLTINTNSINNFSMNTSGNYDVFNVIYSLSNIDDYVFVQYYIYGKSSSVVSFSKSNLFNQIFSEIPEVSIDDLLFHSASIESNSNFNNYDNYLIHSIDFYSKIKDDYILERVSKSE